MEDVVKDLFSSLKGRVTEQETEIWDLLVHSPYVFNSQGCIRRSQEPGIPFGSLAWAAKAQLLEPYSTTAFPAILTGS